MCIRDSTHTHTHTYSYIYTHTYTHTHSPSPGLGIVLYLHTYTLTESWIGYCIVLTHIHAHRVLDWVLYCLWPPIESDDLEDCHKRVAYVVKVHRALACFPKKFSKQKIRRNSVSALLQCLSVMSAPPCVVLPLKGAVFRNSVSALLQCLAVMSAPPCVVVPLKGAVFRKSVSALL